MNSNQPPTPDEEARKLWSEVDHYLTDLLVRQDDLLAAIPEESTAAGLPSIAVSPPQGKFLHLLALLTQARAILEIGTLGGYSTIWLARALAPGGRLVTLESESRHAAIARSNIARAGLDGIVDLRLGNALDTLPRIAEEGLTPFDLIFIDADKENIPAYFDWALRLARRGTLIIVDNVIRSGKVIAEDGEDASVQGVRRFNEMVASDPRVTATALQTVGAKGYDGLALVLVTGDL